MDPISEARQRVVREQLSGWLRQLEAEEAAIHHGIATVAVAEQRLRKEERKAACLADARAALTAYLGEVGGTNA